MKFDFLENKFKLGKTAKQLLKTCQESLFIYAELSSRA